MKGAKILRQYLIMRLALLWAFSVIPTAGAAEDARLGTRVDALVQPLVNDGKVVGLAIGIIRGGETHVFSYCRLAKNRPEKPTADTIFEIGAIGQAFTGLLLADMGERGLVRLDQRVQDLLPDTVAVPKRGDRSITLIDLVTHTSALPRMPDNFKPNNKANPFADYTIEQLYDCLSRHSLVRDPGSKFEYSNLGMGLLGHALALRAGMNYEELFKRRIGEPLGLKQTAMTLTEAQNKSLAQGYNARGMPASQWDIPTLTGAGGHRSSVNDLLRFMRANIDPSRTSLEKALRASQVQRFERFNMPRVAMAWVFTDIGSEDTLALSGATGGFRSFAAFDRKLKIGVVVLANTVGQDTNRLGGQLLSLLSPPVAGIGTGLSWQGEDAVYPTVTGILPGSAAAKSGAIAVGDRLLGIEDEGGKFVDFKGKSQRGVLALIRGRRGSTLRLVVEPKEGNGRMIYELVREIIEPAAPAPSPSKR